MIISTFVYFLFFIRVSYEINNGLGRTPQMGKRKKKNSFAQKIYVYFSPSKDGTVGIIFVTVSMKW